MEKMILHGTSVAELKSIIGDVFDEKIQEIVNQSHEKGDYYVTTKEACGLLRISSRTLSTYCNNGIVQKHRIGGRVLYRRDEITAAIDKKGGES